MTQILVGHPFVRKLVGQTPFPSVRLSVHGRRRRGRGGPHSGRGVLHQGGGRGGGGRGAAAEEAEGGGRGGEEEERGGGEGEGRADLGNHLPGKEDDDVLSFSETIKYSIEAIHSERKEETLALRRHITQWMMRLILPWSSIRSRLRFNIQN